MGTNLLVVSAGQSLFGEDSSLPEEAVDMIAGLPEVELVSAVGSVDANVYRTDKIPSEKSGGIAVKAARTDLIGTVGHVYDEDFARAIDLITSGAIDASAMITHHLPLDRALDGFALLAAGDPTAVKVLIGPGA